MVQMTLNNYCSITKQEKKVANKMSLDKYGQGTIENWKVLSVDNTTATVTNYIGTKRTVVIPNYNTVEVGATLQLKNCKGKLSYYDNLGVEVEETSKSLEKSNFELMNLGYDY